MSNFSMDPNALTGNGAGVHLPVGDKRVHIPLTHASSGSVTVLGS